MGYRKVLGVATCPLRSVSTSWLLGWVSLFTVCANPQKPCHIAANSVNAPFIMNLIYAALLPAAARITIDLLQPICRSQIKKMKNEPIWLSHPISLYPKQNTPAMTPGRFVK